MATEGVAAEEAPQPKDRHNLTKQRGVGALREEMEEAVRMLQELDENPLGVSTEPDVAVPKLAAFSPPAATSPTETPLDVTMSPGYLATASPRPGPLGSRAASKLSSDAHEGVSEAARRRAAFNEWCRSQTPTHASLRAGSGLAMSPVLLENPLSPPLSSTSTSECHEAIDGEVEGTQDVGLSLEEPAGEETSEIGEALDSPQAGPQDSGLSGKSSDDDGDGDYEEGLREKDGAARDGGDDVPWRVSPGLSQSQSDSKRPVKGAVVLKRAAVE